LRKVIAVALLIMLILVVLAGCAGKQETATEERQIESETDELIDTEIEETVSEEELNHQVTYYSPFTGRLLTEKITEKAVMVSIENAPQARPQSGLEDASLVYEFLVEGGITRFLALYRDHIPDKIGPVRSLRPYLIETALEYDALLLHAGASPAGFEMLERVDIDHLDQIYKGNYYWRSSQREAPHNLYTGYFKIESYYSRLTGREYEPRFSFQEISFVEPEDIKANLIYIYYWGDYLVLYQYDPENNMYKRFLSDLDHSHTGENNQQLTVRNIIIQRVDTEVIDSVGRLNMELDGTGQAFVFRDGIVIEGYWEKKDNNWTIFYDQEGNGIKLNPGKTWIQIIPESAKLSFEE
jgi:hypothetical protein